MTRKIGYNAKKLGQRLKRLREERGLNQERLGKEIGVTKQLISSIERGCRFASVDVLLQLSKFFGVPMEYLADPKNHCRNYENQVLANELGLSDKVINQLKNRQKKELTYINVLNNIFEIGYGWKLLSLLQNYFFDDYKSKANKDGEYRIVNEDNTSETIAIVVKAETLNATVEVRLHELLAEIKRYFKNNEYDFDPLNLKTKDAYKILQDDDYVEGNSLSEHMKQIENIEKLLGVNIYTK